MTQIFARIGSILAFALLMVCPLLVSAKDAAVPEQEALMDDMVGEWLMTGTVNGERVIHDVQAEWILGRRYVRIHEVSRERDEYGGLAYEAWIHLAWDSQNAKYVVMWLDNTATTNFAEEGVGHGKRDGDRIPFVWRLADGSGIRNTFEYDREDDTWSWAIDNVGDSGAISVFARLHLERK